MERRKDRVDGKKEGQGRWKEGSTGQRVRRKGRKDGKEKGRIIGKKEGQGRWKEGRRGKMERRRTGRKIG